MKSNEFKYPKEIELMSILNSLDNSLIKFKYFFNGIKLCLRSEIFKKTPCKKTDLTSTFFHLNKAFQNKFLFYCNYLEC